jgi:hypothetical protein
MKLPVVSFPSSIFLSISIIWASLKVIPVMEIPTMKPFALGRGPSFSGEISTARTAVLGVLDLWVARLYKVGR